MMIVGSPTRSEQPIMRPIENLDQFANMDLGGEKRMRHITGVGWFN